LQKEFADEDVAVVTICLGCSAEEARAGLKKANAKDLVLLDEYTETAVPYRASTTPITYLVDRAGTIQVSDVGYGSDTEAHLRDEIERLLEE
jgi:hypothetical protein